MQQLAGAVAHGGSELGLFVTLGTYTPDALHMERTRQDLRLINGSRLVELIFEHYAALDTEWKRLLRLVYAVDRSVAEGVGHLARLRSFKSGWTTLRGQRPNMTEP